MDERIKELAEQAGFIIEDGEIYANECFHEITKDLEKFAELIVRECAGICMIEYDTGLDMAPQAPWIAKQIKDHFGVE
jgi:hypothetical protein